MDDASPPPTNPLMLFAILPISNHDPSYHPRRWPSTSEVVEEIQQLYNIAFPMIITGLLLYGKSVISMLFMGRLGKHVLAGGSLSIGFANITGYSILSGLAMGMEAISSQAHGAEQWSLMGHALQRTIALLLVTCIPVTLLWLNVESILLFCGQDPAITAVASTYLSFSLPILVFQSFLNPIKIYLRTQKITMPLTVGAAIALILHVPANYILISLLGLGIQGAALAAALFDFNLLLALLIYLRFSSLHENSWRGWSWECFREWKPLLNLAIPSCVSVCLEWWWYELMIVFSGLLADAPDAISTMGILIQTTSLVYIFPSALSLAVSTRVGNELGANRPERARLSTKVALLSALLMGCTAMAFTTTLRDVWGQAFTSDPAIVSLTAMTLPIVGLCELGNCPQTAGCGVLRGSARPALAANINLACFYGVGMPIAVVMGFVLEMGLVGLWLGLLAAQATCALVMVCTLLTTDWSLQAKRAKELMGGGDGEYKEIREDKDSLCYKEIEKENLDETISVKVVE
ncbi:hypothetical protein MRB53_033699 [Persea americana]|uniref:Uncharacterized protein n=1 Tax=Persea americana TaxID=3435 RepID=A0ACC2KWL7_PERAE|nr:hypothetical protein MRB53_033699 [Persea americana]